MPIIVSVLLQIAFFLIRLWFDNRDGAARKADEDEAERLAAHAAKTGDTKPLRAFIKALRARKKARQARE